MVMTGCLLQPNLIHPRVRMVFGEPLMVVCNEVAPTNEVSQHLSLAIWSRFWDTNVHDEPKSGYQQYTSLYYLNITTALVVDGKRGFPTNVETIISKRQGVGFSIPLRKWILIMETRANIKCVSAGTRTGIHPSPVFVKYSCFCDEWHLLLNAERFNLF